MTNEKPFTKAGDFPAEVLKLFDQYVHNVIDRRSFLDGAAKFAVGGLTAAGFLEALSPRFAEAQQVSPHDPRLKRFLTALPVGGLRCRHSLDLRREGRRARATGRSEKLEEWRR